MQARCIVWPGILLLGLALDLATRFRPAEMPGWLPYDFSWLVYLGASLALAGYARGLVRTAPSQRPRRSRQLCFVSGTLLIYAVLQTRFDYMAQHMFALSRVQHLVTHHIGPFLVALAHPGAVLSAGLPARMRRALRNPWVGRFVASVQQPVIAGILFVGILLFWLIPPIMAAAMLDRQLYALMNASMVIDGLLFWFLVLDARPLSPALSYGARLLLVFAVQWPQIAGGALIGISETALYPTYTLCGRLYPATDAITDQQIGAFLIWFGGGMMSSIAALLLLRAMRAEERRLTSLEWRALQNAPGRSTPA